MPPKPSDPVPSRPQPAVGQVWRDQTGRLYLIGFDLRNDMYGWIDEVGDVFGHREDMDSFKRAIEASDTYVGQFAGFKVQEGGK